MTARAAAALPLLAASLSAHVMSMSSGELRVEDGRATLEARLPLYEVSHLDDPERSVLDAFRLSIGGRGLQRAAGRCEEDAAEGTFLCRAEYAFAEAPDEIEIECALVGVTVPNHVHVLRIVRGDFADQRVFDFTTRRGTVRFRPPTFVERLRREAGGGAARVLTGPAQVLFLFALALAARRRREGLEMAAAFVLAQSAAAAVAASQGWQPPPRFVEAAGALTISYLAAEVLFLPDAGSRTWPAAAMGVFHGMYFSGFLQQSEMSPLLVLAGAAAAGLLLLAVFGRLVGRLKADFGAERLMKFGSGALLAVGLIWFLFRLRG